MKKENIIIGIVALAVVAFVVGRLVFKDKGDAVTKPTAPAQVAQAPAEAPAAPAVARFAVAGKSPAKVTLVEISDFQCPFCSRGAATVQKVKEAYKDDVAVMFVNLPLSFHKNARPAAIAAYAAHRQGKFWPMHDKLFANARELTPDNFKKWAAELGLDAARFAADLNDPALGTQVDQDTAIANGLGVRGTPGFFVNGVNISGAQPFENFKKIIDEQLTKANDALGKGTAIDKLHETMWRQNNAALADNAIKWLIRGETPPTTPAAAPKPEAAEAAEPPEDRTVWKVEFHGKEPVDGPADAPVTMVEYTDFQCPFCSRVRPAVKQVMKEYAGKVRLVFKHQPLPFHKNAFGAAEASLCANDQGKFWEMEEQLFTNQGNLTGPELSGHAKTVGLDVARFDACMKDRKYKQQVLDDQEMADRVTATGTPAFFINGRKISGAQPFSAFKALIDEEMKKAEALIAAGTPKAEIYAKTVAGGKQNIPPPLLDTKVTPFDYNGSPIHGDKNAKVKIAVFKDFQCPFCGRVSAPLKQLEKENKGKVAIVFKHFPLSNQCNPGMGSDMHPAACQAAYWSMAALEQGKFSAFEDVVFNNMQNMMPRSGDLTSRLAAQRENLIKYAQQVGMDTAKAEAYVKARKYEARIRKDISEASRANVRGTPAVYMNGRAYNGPLNPAKLADTVEKLLAGKI